MNNWTWKKPICISKGNEEKCEQMNMEKAKAESNFSFWKTQRALIGEKYLCEELENRKIWWKVWPGLETRTHLARSNLFHLFPDIKCSISNLMLWVFYVDYNEYSLLSFIFGSFSQFFNRTFWRRNINWILFRYSLLQWIFWQKADVHVCLPLSLFSYVSCNQLHGSSYLSCVFCTILPGLKIFYTSAASAASDIYHACLILAWYMATEFLANLHFSDTSSSDPILNTYQASANSLLEADGVW